LRIARLLVVPLFGLLTGEPLRADSPGPSAAPSQSPTPSPSPPISVCGGGQITEAVLGYEQVGASGLSSSQKYFFNFFISRPIPMFKGAESQRTYRNGTKSKETCESDPDWGPKARWWGTVRVGSYPQQVNSSASSFAQSFSTGVGNLQVNQLAQELDFTTGPEFRLAGGKLKTDLSDPDTTRGLLTLFAGIGASGPNNPSSNAAVLTVPPPPGRGATATAQYQAFNALYPKVPPPYVAFLPDRQSHFLRAWDIGFRLYTFFGSDSDKPVSSAPGLVQVALGQNELVTGRLSGWTFHATAVYPFQLGSGPRDEATTLVLFLFGEAYIGLGGQVSTPTQFSLAQAKDSAGNAIPLTDPGVTIVNVPANRVDVYRVGVGVDLNRVWNKLTAKSSNTTDTSKTGAD
jgi:hypothetical protein